MIVERFHHVAYRCKDAKATVAFYRDRRDWWEPLTARVKNR